MAMLRKRAHMPIPHVDYKAGSKILKGWGLIVHIYSGHTLVVKTGKELMFLRYLANL